MAVVKKKSEKKKSSGKASAKKKDMTGRALEPKLGHDPLAWITGNMEDVVSPSNIVVEPEKNSEDGKEVVVDSSVAIVANENIEHEIDKEVVDEVVTVKEREDLSETKDNTMLNLPDVFGIAQAEVAYNEIKQLLVSSDEIKIDGSAVETVDASALQLLISLFEECKSKGIKISWHSESDKVNDSAKLLNITQSLNLKM